MLKYLSLVVLLFLPWIVRAADEPAIDLETCTLRGMPPGPPAEIDKKAKKKKDKSAGPNTMILSRVVCEVEKALDAYQQSPEVADSKPTLPILKTADFDFKTVIDTKAGFTFNILIFKVGASVEKQDTNDVDFQYQPASLALGIDANRTKSLQEELLNTIKAAIKAVQEQRQAPREAKDPLVLKGLTITISYGVTWDVNGGINAPIHLVTIGGTIDRSKNNVQQVKLVFEDLPKKPKP